MATQLDKVVFPTGDYIEVSDSTDEKVIQTATSTNADYEVLFSGTADNTTRTEGARKDSNLLYNPSSNTLGLKNTGISNSITPSSISLSNSSGGSISIDNTNNKIEVGKSGTSITYSNTDIVTSNGNTWDGTNTSLKTSIANAGKTKVIQGILRRESGGYFDDNVLIPLDTVFELGYNYILEINADGDGGSLFYKRVILKFQLENVTVNDNTGGSGDHITYHFSCVNSPESTMLKRIGDNAGNYYSYVTFSTLNGEPSETYTKDSITYWESDSYIQQASSNYALDDKCYLLNQNKLSLSGGTMTGALTMPNGLYYEPGNTSYGINANDSDIINLNGLYFKDATDSGGEGINFYRNSSHWDTLIDENGWLKVKEYRANNNTTYSNLFTIPYGIQPIKFAVGTVVRTIGAVTAYTLFNATQMKDLLKTTATVNASNCVVWVMNGDDAAQSGRDITANYWNGTNLNVRFRTTANAGAYRFNYLIAFWG